MDTTCGMCNKEVDKKITIITSWGYPACDMCMNGYLNELWTEEKQRRSYGNK